MKQIKLFQFRRYQKLGRLKGWKIGFLPTFQPSILPIFLVLMFTTACTLASPFDKLVAMTDEPTPTEEIIKTLQPTFTSTPADQAAAPDTHAGSHLAVQTGRTVYTTH